MRQTEILRVRQQNVPVELALADSAPRPVEIFLDEHQAHAFRRQHILDLLEGEAAFLPARDSTSGVWEIFNKDALLWIRVPLEPLGQSGAESSEELFDFQSACGWSYAAGRRSMETCSTPRRKRRAAPSTT